MPPRRLDPARWLAALNAQREALGEPAWHLYVIRHERADELGDTFTDEMIERIDEKLGRPERCPHGWPVDPGVEQAENADLAPLAALAPGTRATIVRLAEHDGDLLHWFYDQDLVPGTAIALERAEPAADAIRPQFASWPCSAVFTRGEVATRSAIARASASLAAPRTTISASTVAPSPSATIFRASSAQTLRRQSENSSSEAGVRSILLAPFASSRTESFVEHSPSTEIALKLASTAGRRNGSASPGSSG